MSRMPCLQSNWFTTPKRPGLHIRRRHKAWYEFYMYDRKFSVLRSLNVEHIHLQEVNEEGAEPIDWNCCESDNPGKVWIQKAQNYEHSCVTPTVLLQCMVIHKKDPSCSRAASVAGASPQKPPLVLSVLLPLLNSVFFKKPFPTRKTMQLRLKS